jgi:hypothetical protein
MTTKSKGKKKCGVELDDATGTHSGSVGGATYFKCPPGHGTLVDKGLVKLVKVDTMYVLLESCSGVLYDTFLILAAPAIMLLPRCICSSLYLLFCFLWHPESGVAITIPFTLAS